MISVVTPSVHAIRTHIHPSVYSSSALLATTEHPSTLSVVPIIPVTTSLTTYPFVIADSGLNESPLSRFQINDSLRSKFLTKWLYAREQAEIIRRLKVKGDEVVVLSKENAEKNDISTDTRNDINKKIKFIGNEILRLGKSEKILNAVALKLNVNLFDLPYYKTFVRDAMTKYVIKKLKEMESKITS